ncbi:MAG TPA: GAF domain-containing sensor histidine kinase, partial [Dehalococcoidia bacterium]|nr:GAF domain-containing sensor histidine kinase [Dehalococcoidia bacterium]
GRGLLPEPPPSPISLRGDPLQRLVLERGQPVLVDDVRSDGRLAGSPPPAMVGEGTASVLVVPFSARGKLLGTLMVQQRQPGRFGPQEAELLRALADWAAVAVETHRLYEATRSLALLEERERIAMDLHDGVIQSLYALGLSLEGLSERLRDDDPHGVRPHLEEAIDALERVMQDIRDYIYDLRPQALRGEDLAQALAELARGAQEVAGVAVQVQVQEPLPDLDAERALAIYHVAQEAISNVVKHAQAKGLRLSLQRRGQALVLEVEDDGIGFDPGAASDQAGQGLRNMADRARTVQGVLTVDSAPGHGTRVRLEVPLAEVTV